MMNKEILTLLCLLVFTSLKAQLVLETNESLTLNNKKASFYLSETGKYNRAQGFDFNPSTTKRGLTLEYGENESGGFYTDGNTAIIWSGSESGRLLRFYNTDYMNGTLYERAYIDADGAYFANSDLSRKEDIMPLDSSLVKLMCLRGVSYTYRSSGVSDSLESDVATRPVNLGFIAQEVEPVFPELVQRDEYGSLFVNYQGMIPVLTEAVKAQQTRIELLESQVKAQQETMLEMQKEMAELRKRVR